MHHDPRTDTSEPPRVPPSISVCMACYNGERFIAEQIDSILAQLPPDAELIVCDDGSKDRTREIVRGYDDRRVLLHVFERNAGHVGNFERALALATGDIVFLSDQDDVWEPDKVATVMDVFARAPDTAMVVHPLALIDGAGRPLERRIDHWTLAEAGVQPRARYLLRQLAKCQITGCATAFRREVAALMLPFPNQAYAHDHWLAVAAPMVGAVVFLDRPLIRYRQHDANVSPRTGLGWTRRITVRAKMLGLLAEAWRRARSRRA